MGTKPTAIISCFGIIGILIAALCGDKSEEAKYFIRQSGNALICTAIFSIVISMIAVFLGGGFISKLLTILSNLYGIIIFIEILVSAIRLEKTEIWGLYKFLK